jgi:hypothetical protein
VLGVVVAAAVLQMLQTGFDVLRVNQFLYQAVQGLILIAVLAVNVRARGWLLRPARPTALASGQDGVPPDGLVPGEAAAHGAGNILAASEITHRDD